MLQILRIPILVACCTLHATSVSSQSIETSLLNLLEDSMKVQCKEIVYGKSSLSRFNADSLFTKTFVRALKINNSFYYSFDSLKNISRLYAPDSSFRIFTWQMEVNDNLTRQHGAIQMRTDDGTLKLFPLIDKSDVTENIEETTANNKSWIGAVYYKIILTQYANQTFYTLLGFDQHNMKSDRKIIDVVTFKNQEPIFGNQLFSFEESPNRKEVKSRYVMEFKKEASARLVYDDDLKMIVAEHLQSETNEPAKKWTYIPDGDYEGFKWMNGRWIHVNKVFNQITPEGKEPVPRPYQESKLGH